MIYDITLKMAYTYRSAVKDARHILRIRPRGSEGQTVVSQSLRVLPEPDETASDRDFFGNGIDHIFLHRPHEALSVEMRARVRVASRAVDLASTPPREAVGASARRTRDAGPASPAHFLGPSRLVPRSAAVQAYVRASLDHADSSGLSDGPASAGTDMLALTRRIREDFTYAPGTTRIDTPVEEVFAKRRGVCQDFAQLMIAGLRAVGLPAAYVSGFLRTEPPPGEPRLEGADAMHAWVKVWLGDEAGWVGFDPTNGGPATSDHIEVAIGRDYADVAPIGGVLVTSGPQKMRHSVDIVPISTDPAES